MSDQKKRPLVPTGIVTEFGEVLDNPAELAAETGADNDLTYVPGFSDMRRNYDLAKARGEKPVPLPVNMRWARRTQINGQPTNARLVQHQNLRYRPATKDDIGQPWLKALPAAATILPDGSIGMADNQLMVCDQRDAAGNAYKRLMRWKQANEAAKDSAFLAKAQFEGANPVVTVETPKPAA